MDLKSQNKTFIFIFGVWSVCLLCIEGGGGTLKQIPNCESRFGVAMCVSLSLPVSKYMCRARWMHGEYSVVKDEGDLLVDCRHQAVRCTTWKASRLTFTLHFSVSQSCDAYLSIAPFPPVLLSPVLWWWGLFLPERWAWKRVHWAFFGTCGKSQSQIMASLPSSELIPQFLKYFFSETETSSSSLFPLFL